jgi:hypothetical protein
MIFDDNLHRLISAANPPVTLSFTGTFLHIVCPNNHHHHLDTQRHQRSPSTPQFTSYPTPSTPPRGPAALKPSSRITSPPELPTSTLSPHTNLTLHPLTYARATPASAPSSKTTLCRTRGRGKRCATLFTICSTLGRGRSRGSVREGAGRTRLQLVCVAIMGRIGVFLLRRGSRRGWRMQLEDRGLESELCMCIGGGDHGIYGNS